MSDPLINFEAEGDLLGLLLRENRDVDRIADLLSPDDFAEPAHRTIYETIVQQVSLGKSATPVTLKGFFGDELNTVGGPGYLARLTADSIPVDAKDAAKYLADLAMRRAMRGGLAVASEACADLTLPIAEIVSHADEAISQKAGEQIHQPTGADCFDELLASFGQDRQGVTCGQINALDELLGPMRPKQLIIGAGRPGMGKTALALSYAIGAAQRGHGVLFVSLEMSSTELAARMAADMCFNGGNDGVPFAAINAGDPNSYQRSKVAQAAVEMQSLPFQVIDAGSLTVGRLNMLIRRHARRMKAQGQKLELVIVDYLQLLSPDSKGRSNYEAVSEVSRALKAMAKDHGVAVFALAQLSREVEKRPGNRPQLSDLRDSGQIEQDADAVLFLLREEYYLRQQDPETVKDPIAHEAALRAVEGRIEFIVAKRRNGITGQAQGWFYGQYQAVRG